MPPNQSSRDLHLSTLLLNQQYKINLNHVIFKFCHKCRVMRKGFLNSKFKIQILYIGYTRVYEKTVCKAS